MTPYDCIQDITHFLKENLKAYEGRNEETQKPVLCYAGFLPRARSAELKAKYCPAVVVGYRKIDDTRQESTVSIVITVTAYDEDMLQGCMTLYHLLEYVRQQLWMHNPICNRYQIRGGTMETFIPDEHPYPQWYGRIDFDVNIPQPERYDGWI